MEVLPIILRNRAVSVDAKASCESVVREAQRFTVVRGEGYSPTSLPMEAARHCCLFWCTPPLTLLSSAAATSAFLFPLQVPMVRIRFSFNSPITQAFGINRQSSSVHHSNFFFCSRTRFLASNIEIAGCGRPLPMARAAPAEPAPPPIAAAATAAFAAATLAAREACSPPPAPPPAAAASANGAAGPLSKPDFLVVEVAAACFLLGLGLGLRLLLDELRLRRRRLDRSRSRSRSRPRLRLRLRRLRLRDRSRLRLRLRLRRSVRRPASPRLPPPASLSAAADPEALPPSDAPCSTPDIESRKLVAADDGRVTTLAPLPRSCSCSCSCGGCATQGPLDDDSLVPNRTPNPPCPATKAAISASLGSPAGTPFCFRPVGRCRYENSPLRDFDGTLRHESGRPSCSAAEDSLLAARYAWLASARACSPRTVIHAGSVDPRPRPRPAMLALTGPLPAPAVFSSSNHHRRRRQRSPSAASRRADRPALSVSHTSIRSHRRQQTALNAC
jgi:hypothetical protein